MISEVEMPHNERFQLFKYASNLITIGYKLEDFLIQWGIQSCSKLACCLLNMTHQTAKFDRVINRRIIVLQVVFLYNLESLDLNTCSKGYDLNTKTCTVWIRVWIDFELHLIWVILLFPLGLSFSPSSSRTLSSEFELE